MPPHRAPGVVNGQLADCPGTPNCVCTQASDARFRMEPIPFSGSAEDAMARVKRTLEGLRRVRIVRADGRYIHAEFRTPVFRFVDDVEFLIDAEAGVIHFRSASRVGYGDLGTNRRRMAKLRRLLEA